MGYSHNDYEKVVLVLVLDIDLLEILIQTGYCQSKRHCQSGETIKLKSQSPLKLVTDRKNAVVGLVTTSDLSGSNRFGHSLGI